VKNIASPRFTLLIRDNNHETAITYMNPRCKPLVRCRRSLVRGKKQNAQNRPPKGPKSKNFLCSFIKAQLPNPLRKKKFPLHNPFNVRCIYIQKQTAEFKYLLELILENTLSHSLSSCQPHVGDYSLTPLYCTRVCCG